MIITRILFGALVTIEVDATVREEHHGETVVTEYHVERGADVADHARPGNDRITCDVVVTNTPIKAPTTNTDGVRGGFSAVPMTVPTITHIPHILPGVGIVASLLPPSSQTVQAEVLNFDGEMNRIKNVYDELTLIRTTAEVIQISTPLREYTDMVIRTLSGTRGPADGSSITFTFTASAIRFVDSEIVAVTADDVKTKSMGVKPGKAPSPADKQSVLDRMGTSMGALTHGNAATELLK